MLLKKDIPDPKEIQDVRKVDKIKAVSEEGRKDVAKETLSPYWMSQTIFVPEEEDLESENFRYKPNKNLKNLQGLYNLLIKLFNNEKLKREDLELKDFELRMALKFVFKKHINRQNRQTFDEVEFRMEKEVFLEFFNGLVNKKSTKRLAEEIKLIFNFVVKQMKLKFQKSQNLFTTFSKINIVFYTHHFKDRMD